MIDHLKKLAGSVLFEQDVNKQHECICALQDIYLSLTGVGAQDLAGEDLMLPAGKALSPSNAARCLLDTPRTVGFLRGIHKAILQLKKDFPREKINILYAGCGPYATLLTPFTALFSSAELGFYLLDVNQVSLAAVQRLYSDPDLEGYVKEIICADATIYRLPENDLIHLVISETMQNGLNHEPQVAIMLHLMPQMAEKAVFIPEEISISLTLLEKADTSNGSINEHSVQKDLDYTYTIGRKHCAAPAKQIVQLPEQTGKPKYLALSTSITVFGDERLLPYTCGLTTPLILADTEREDRKKMELRYEMGRMPGFYFNWLS